VSSTKNAKLIKSSSFVKAARKPALAIPKKPELEQYATIDPKSVADTKTKSSFTIGQFQLYQSTQPKE